MPKLSVVIAYQDRADQVVRSLDAWSRQDDCGGSVDIETILVDDGSRYGIPVGIGERYGTRIIQIQGDPTRRNPAVAWNAGLRAATGDVLACTHPEIIPSNNVARFMVGTCLGDPRILDRLRVWVPGKGPGWDQGIKEVVLSDEAIHRLSGYAVRANVTVFRQVEGQPLPEDLTDLSRSGPAFWQSPTDFGGHTNEEILRRFRGFFWNNLFALRADTWRWINYHRPSRDWGMDDEDFQRRNQILGITYAFTDCAWGIHQVHSGSCRGPSDDHFDFKTLDDARLVWLHPETKDQTLALSRKFFWED